jgi:hypothetical protein
MFPWTPGAESTTILAIGALAVATLLSEIGFLVFLALGAEPALDDAPEEEAPAQLDTVETGGGPRRLSDLLRPAASCYAGPWPRR